MLYEKMLIIHLYQRMICLGQLLINMLLKQNILKNNYLSTHEVILEEN